MIFRQPSGPGKELESTIFLVGRRGGRGGGDHLIFRRTEGGIIRNWEPKKEIIAEELELEELRRTTHIRLRAVSRFARLAASPLPRACIALTKSEEKERLLAV